MACVMPGRLKLPKDQEGDSQMSPATDSSQGEGSDAMFPAANDASSNLHPTASNQQAPGELSPPYSQDQPDADGDEAMDLTGDEPGSDVPGQATNGGMNYGGRNESTKAVEAKNMPGQSWDNPKARDDYQRQWNALLDKGFSLSKFNVWRRSMKATNNGL